MKLGRFACRCPSPPASCRDGDPRGNGRLRRTSGVYGRPWADGFSGLIEDPRFNRWIGYLWHLIVIGGLEIYGTLVINDEWIVQFCAACNFSETLIDRL